MAQLNVGDLFITIQRGTCTECQWLDIDGCAHELMSQSGERFIPPLLEDDGFGCSLFEEGEEALES